MKPPDIIDILTGKGPQTGRQLQEITNLEVLPLWQICRRTSEIHAECVGKRFLRLDRNVAGYARLSPSIRREFLTYTILGLQSQSAEMEVKARHLRQEIIQISQAKFDLAKEAMSDITESFPDWRAVRDRICFIIAGDVTYGMAHTVPRPEFSTGRMVQGSDLDIIVVAEDEAPRDALKALDNAILRKKHLLLINPNYQEEIDYLVKTIAKVRTQLAFDTFQHMIASKILYEGEFLFGSTAVFKRIKAMVDEFGVPEKLTALEKQAAENREQAEMSLLEADATQADAPFLNLFYTREEGDEIY